MGTDAEREPGPTPEPAIQLDDPAKAQPVGKHQRLGSRIDPVVLVVGDQPFAPLDRIARVVARTIEELAEVHIEIAQECIHPVHVRQRDTQVAAVLSGPGLEAERLRIPQARSERLAGLQIFVRHRAQRDQAVRARIHHVARARQVLPQIRLQRPQHFVVPAAGESAACAIVGDPHLRQRRIVPDQGDLGPQSATTLGEVGGGHGATKVDLVDDRQHRDLEQDRVQPWSPDPDIDFPRPVGGRFDPDVLGVQLKQRQEIDEVALDEAQPAQIIELALGQTQRAQVRDFPPDRLDVRRQIDTGRAALEPVLDLCARKLMQYHLHHRELVQVRVQQGIDDHDKIRIAARPPPQA